MIRVFCVVLVLSFFLTAGPVQAQTQAIFSGAYLMELCKRNEKGKEVTKGAHTACQAYIAGVVDYHQLLSSLGTAPSIDFCIPKETKPGVLQDVVFAYLEANAQNDAFVAAPAVSIALYEAFPCD